MHMRSALLAGENRFVDLLCQRAVCSEDACAARSAQGFMRGKGDHVSVTDRRGNGFPGDQASDVRHIRKQVCADGVCDGAEARPIRNPGIRGITADDDPGHDFFRLRFQLFVVYLFGFRVNIVMSDLVKFSGTVHR